MKGYSRWSYQPYRHVLFETGDIYISRIAPSADTIHLEWLPWEGNVSVYYRVRGEKEYILDGVTDKNEYDIRNLKDAMQYEIYVQSGNYKSRVRLVRTGDAVGVVVNYLHPDDKVYAFSGGALGSPSMVRHPDGYLLASMDLFADQYPQNLNLIFRSDDDGLTWHYVSELMPSF